MLQASLSIAIIFVSYALQVKYHPFLDPDTRPVVTNKTIAEYAARKDAVHAYAIPYNRLETGYLMTSMFTLLSGMIFQSGYVSVSSKTYLLLTILVRVQLCFLVATGANAVVWLFPQVGSVLVGSVVVFMGLICVEIVRAIRFSRRIRAASRSCTCPLAPSHSGPVYTSTCGPTAVRLAQSELVTNPLARANRRKIVVDSVRTTHKPMSPRPEDRAQMPAVVWTQPGEVKCL